MFVPVWAATCLASTVASCACGCCTLATKEALSRSARLAWVVLFTFSMILAWILRDVARPLLVKLPCEWEDGQRARRSNCARARPGAGG